ncbi:MAG: Beta helix protein [Actinomycetota bacterium]|nr:Beta helix protein [Actinomycetota bacterium]
MTPLRRRRLALALLTAALASAAFSACGDTAQPDPVKAELLSLCTRTEQTDTMDVTNTDELTSALAGARPGQRIFVADGDYKGKFAITAPGTQAAPISLCAAKGATLVGGNSGYTLHLDGADWWSVQGLTVTGGKKGIMLDAVDHSSLVDLKVADTGQEAVHLRTNSSDNVVIGLSIESTGREDPKFGEGVYIGSAESNWCRYTDCQPDRSDRNRILGNTFGPDVTAENIDIKEGTAAGVVEGNSLNGEGATAADSWVDVKGNEWVLRGNTGTAAKADGMQVHAVADGWGRRNRFEANSMTVNAPGYGIQVFKNVTGTIVACSNTAAGAASGLSNVPCTS